jgi:hypothetical protein
MWLHARRTSVSASLGRMVVCTAHTMNSHSRHTLRREASAEEIGAELCQAFTIDSAEKPPNRSCANSYKRIAACAPHRAVYRHSCYSVVYINKGYNT